jgi:hypothetical protein
VVHLIMVHSKCQCCDLCCDLSSFLSCHSCCMPVPLSSSSCLAVACSCTVQVRAGLGFLQETLIDHVATVLDSATGSIERTAPRGWHAVLDKVTCDQTCRPFLIHLQSPTAQAAVCRGTLHTAAHWTTMQPVLPAVIRSKHLCLGTNGLHLQARSFLGRRNAGSDREELQRILQELHADVFTQIDQEVCLQLHMYCIQYTQCVPAQHNSPLSAHPADIQVHGFWHELETAGNERQRALLRRLNAHLEVTCHRGAALSTNQYNL